MRIVGQPEEQQTAMRALNLCLVQIRRPSICARRRWKSTPPLVRIRPTRTIYLQMTKLDIGYRLHKALCPSPLRVKMALVAVKTLPDSSQLATGGIKVILTGDSYAGSQKRLT